MNLAFRTSLYRILSTDERLILNSADKLMSHKNRGPRYMIHTRGMPK